MFRGSTSYRSDYQSSSHVLQLFVLHVQLNDGLAHHIELTVVVLFDYSHFRLSCLKLLHRIIQGLLVFLLHFLNLFFPLSVFLHDLETAALAEFVNTLHLLGHLTDFL